MDIKIVLLSVVGFSLMMPPALCSLSLAQVLLDTAFDGVEGVGEKMADIAQNIVDAKTGTIQSIVGAKGDLANSLINIFRKDKGSYDPDSTEDLTENDIQIACDPLDNTVRVVSLRSPRIRTVTPSFWNKLRSTLRLGLQRSPLKSPLKSLRRNVHSNRRLVHAVRQDVTDNRMLVSPVVYEYITAPRFY